MQRAGEGRTVLVIRDCLLIGTPGGLQLSLRRAETPGTYSAGTIPSCTSNRVLIRIEHPFPCCRLLLICSHSADLKSELCQRHSLSSALTQTVNHISLGHSSRSRIFQNCQALIDASSGASTYRTFEVIFSDTRFKAAKHDRMRCPTPNPIEPYWSIPSAYNRCSKTVKGWCVTRIQLLP